MQQPDFKEVQYQFAASIRDPLATKRDDVPARRMQVYQELFFNNLFDMLSGNFPVLYEIYGDKKWADLIREFMIKHRCKTPLFPELAKEMLQFLEAKQSNNEIPGWQLELAHYEWVELALEISEDELPEPAEAKSIDELKDSILEVSSLAWNLAYNYPVHQISPSFIPEAKPEQATHLLIYRERDYQVAFTQITSATSYLLNLLQENTELTAGQILERMAQQFAANVNPEIILEMGGNALLDFYQREIIF
ncbi:MAG: HvfC family RiPP maturation protein [bacterium]